MDLDDVSVNLGQDMNANLIVIPQSNIHNSKVNENYVKTKIDSMCGCPKKEKMTYY